MEAFAALKKKFIQEQSEEIDEQIRIIQDKIMAGTDSGILFGKIKGKILGRLVDAELYDYSLNEKLEVLPGLEVSNVTSVNGNWLADLTLNGVPVDVKHVSPETILSIVQPPAQGDCYSRRELDSFAYTMNVCEQKHHNYTNSSYFVWLVRKSKDEILAHKKFGDSLASRIRYTDKLLVLFQTQKIVERLTGFMKGVYGDAEVKIKRGLTEQIDKYMSQFKSIVTRQPFYVNRYPFPGVTSEYCPKVTPGMIEAEVNELFKDIVLRQIVVDFDLCDEDFRSEESPIIAEYRNQIYALKRSKKEISQL
jgi:hypothetical protein